MFMARALVALAALASGTALAKFNGRERSINGTGETLPEGSAELGFTTFAFGVTDQLMLSLPTLPLLNGAIGIEARYKLSLNRNVRVSPFAGIGYGTNSDEPAANAGAVFGFDSTDRRHSFDLGAQIRRYPKFVVREKSDEESDDAVATRVLGQLEYNHYTRGGNLFYLGAWGGMPYWGFTWAWENVHLGLIGALPTMFIPLPYIYLRF